MEQWRSVVSFRLGDPNVFDWHLNYMDFTIKTTGRCNYLCQPTDSPEESLEALTRYKDPSKMVYPQIVT